MLQADTIDTLIKQAKKSDMRSKHAAIIINKGRIISTGHNQTYHSIKRYISNNKTSRPLSRHAEEDALRRVDRRNLKGATLYVIRFGMHHHNQPFMNSKPCKRCMASIHKMMREDGLRRIFYSIDTDEDGCPIWNEISV